MFHQQPEHCWKWNSIEMGRGTAIELCLQRHNPPPFLCALQTPLLSLHGTWSYKLPQQNLRAAAQGPRTPAQLGCAPVSSEAVAGFPRRLSMSVKTRSSGEFISEKLLCSPRTENPKKYLFVKYYGQVQFLLGLKAG